MSKTKAKTVDPLAHDFRNFLFAIWKHLGLPDPTPVQYDIAQFLQHGPKRSIIQAFRGVGKSWITAAYVCWLLYRNPDHKVLVVSANATKATEFTTFVLQLINEVSFLKKLKPRHDQRQSTLSFDVNGAKPSQSPSVKSIGITGQITGGRANTIVPDDIEIPHNSDTPGKRDTLLERVKEFDAVLLPGGDIKYLGTPQTEQTIYAVLKDRGYVTRVWPARMPKDIAVYGGTLAPFLEKKRLNGELQPLEPTDPARFDDADLQERELSYGRSGFALQFLLDTTLSDAEKHPLKLADLIVHPLDTFRAPTDIVWAADKRHVLQDLPMVGLQGDRFYRAAWMTEEYAPYEGSIMYVDPAGRGKDETAFAVVKLLHGRLYLTKMGGFQGTGYEEDVLRGLLMVAKQQSCHKVIVEPNFGGGMFAQLLRAAAQRYYGVTIEDGAWSNTQKEMRIIDTLEPVMNQHRLVVCPSVIQHDYEDTQRYGDKASQYRAFYQMTRITRERGALAQDDRLDALAGAVHYWLEHMSRDTEKARLQHRDEQINKELEKFVKGALSLNNSGLESRRFSSSQGRRAQGTTH
jgi:hypothetical protein